jgi:hypothetical protein
VPRLPPRKTRFLHLRGKPSNAMLSMAVLWGEHVIQHAWKLSLTPYVLFNDASIS